ncbi:AIPR family protein [Yinghuangia seranimata]|uniref:AIPR family protein n=1 Tax=Yinghuangia seranimata TaxID=408067 RepID=UPI00248B25EC|nr:AIPR family protein [Yinghuangia seranimata]MDI2125098.1 AIPR family protein [Yinghuangia seranimata]
MRSALIATYRGLIDESDLQRNSEPERDRAFLSRAVAATAIRHVTGWAHEDCAAAVVDGSHDNGIDAVAVTEASRVWLVQAKWKDSGTAGFQTDAARAFIEGLHLLEHRKFDLFNDRITPFTQKLDAALRDTNLKITLVVAVVGNDPLHDDTKAILNRAVDDHYGHGPMLDYRLMGAAELLQQLRDDRSPDPVHITARMPQWIKRDLPFPAYQGSVSAGQVAEWYDEHGSKLFTENIRQSLGATRINTGIQQTLTGEPDNFWYFNNGITILCDEIVPDWPGRRVPNEPVVLSLKRASIVNGAQTVTEIAKAMEHHPETVEFADVSLKVISLGAERGSYAARITETTNTQNDVSERDFIALDPTQADIRSDFDVMLQKAYVVKRGEADPAPEAGCSVEHAAIALACAHNTPELAVRANKSTDLLWERGSSGAYQRLFGERPSALRIWHSVLIQRAVGDALDASRKALRGRAVDVSKRGDLIVAHLVFQLIDTDEIDEPDYDITPILKSVPALTESVLSWLIHHVDSEFGTNSFLTSTFTNEKRCKALAEAVVRDVRRGGPVPELPEDYQPPARTARQTRRPPTVPTLVNAEILPAGTRLTYVAGNVPEAEAVNSWLAEDPARGQATWQNERTRPLLWAYDGQTYTANKLVLKIWELAGWNEAPVAVQAPARWTPDGKRNLYEIAVDWLDAQNDEE